MPRPRFQFSVRRMMIVVGLLAVALGVAIVGWRSWMSFAYWQRAKSYARMADYWRWQSRRIPELYPGWDQSEVGEGLDKAILWNRQMENKYRRAASHPWETLPPDPPRP
jgi:hypothetical protein